VLRVSPEPDDADRLLETDVDHLGDRSLEEIRALRAACLDVETGLSYLRRMVQGPLDITRREQAHRSSGVQADVSDLVSELPDVLADGPRAGGVGRLPQSLEPKQVDPALQAELDAILGAGRVTGVTSLSDADLESLAGELEQFERKVSDRRRRFHHLIDALQAELARRYQSGEASVESLLD
jgi:hypothetical protein